jgi:hypothetical protein
MQQQSNMSSTLPLMMGSAPPVGGSHAIQTGGVIDEAKVYSLVADLLEPKNREQALLGRAL